MCSVLFVDFFSLPKVSGYIIFVCSFHEFNTFALSFAVSFNLVLLLLLLVSWLFRSISVSVAMHFTSRRVGKYWGFRFISECVQAVTTMRKKILENFRLRSGTKNHFWSVTILVIERSIFFVFHHFSIRVMFFFQELSLKVEWDYVTPWT